MEMTQAFKLSISVPTPAGEIARGKWNARPGSWGESEPHHQNLREIASCIGHRRNTFEHIINVWYAYSSTNGLQQKEYYPERLFQDAC